MTKVQITLLMDTPTPAQISKYFANNGWEDVGKSGPYTKFSKRIAPAEPEPFVYHAVIDDTLCDYPFRCHCLLRDLANIEERQSGDILKEMIDFRCPCCGYPKCGHETHHSNG